MKNSLTTIDFRHYFHLKPKILCAVILVFVCCYTSNDLWAQDQGSFTISRFDSQNISDWKIELRVGGSPHNGMDCNGSDTYYHYMVRNGIRSSRINGSLKNNTKRTIDNVGINTSSTWKMEYKVDGSLWNCHYWKNSNTITLSTSRLKAPNLVVASDSTSESAVENAIKITWDKGTHVPDKTHHYYIARDGDFENKVHITGMDPREWIDKDVNPGEIHTYSIWTWVGSSTWGQHQSDTIEVTGSTIPMFSASDGESFSKTQVKITWPKMPASVKSIKIFKEGLEIANITNMDATRVFYDDNEVIPGYQYDYTFTPASETNGDGAFPSQKDTGFARSNGRIKGTVKAPFGGPVEGAIVYAERVGNIPQGEDQSLFSDTTNASGLFDIQNIYYHEEADFNIYPEKGEHGFNPASLDVTLSLQYPTYDLGSPAFTDTSSFTVKGKIVQLFALDSAGVEGVEILVNGNYKGTKTDSKGEFALTVEEIGEYTIKPRFLEHDFNPAVKTFQIESDVTSVFFEDIETDTLSGYFLGGCDIYIGQADIRIFNSENPAAAFDTTITTSAGSGYYEIVLPSRKYTVSIVDFMPDPEIELDKNEVIDFFQTYEVDLTEESAVKDFIFRKPPEIEILGFPEAGCAPYEVPIVEQVVNYHLEINVFESFGDERCLTNSGYLVIIDEVKDAYNETYELKDSIPVSDTLKLENGSISYNLFPGEPNIVGGGDHPYQKKISFHANVEGQTADLQQYVLIEGNKPREQTFTTVSPEIPFMILRDPPGDGSYSFLSENTTTNTSMKMFAKSSIGTKSWGSLKVGNKTLQGMGVFIEQKFWAKIKASLSVGASIKGQEEFAMSISNETEFSTSGNQEITGEEGDLFVGSAINLIYALTDVITFDPEGCTADADTSIIMGNDGFNTTFMYTESHIRNSLIPDLEIIEQAQTNPDSSKIYRNQIEVWNQTLENNIKLKEEAKKSLNRSFSAGADFTSSHTVSTSKSTSISYSLYIATSVAVSAGIEIAGAGFEGGSEIKSRIDIGGSQSTKDIYTRTTGFHLQDDDIGDFFSVDIKEDEVYGTPVFDLVSGRSSCPWEPGTQPREGAQLNIDKKVQYDIEQDGEAVFKLTLGNTSQSNEDRTYSLLFLPESNPDFADVDWNGKGSADGLQIPIPAGNSVEQTIIVKKGPNSNTYQDLQFALVSDCDAGLIGDTVSFSVYFNSNCSPIAISKPANHWLINENNSNHSNVEIFGYDIDNLNNIVLEYKNLQSGVWRVGNILEKAELGATNTVIDWDVTSLDDGEYDIRVKVSCGESNGEFSYSDLLSGRIDREAPRIFGAPEPTDGDYENGDEISVSFYENLNCFNISASNVIFKDKNSGNTYTVGVGCRDNKVTIVPLTEESFLNQVMEVALVDIEDQFGNIRDNSIIWEFEIGTADFKIDAETDSDGDGILDISDNCPFTHNVSQEDSDKDGIGDVCDEDIDGDDVLNVNDNCPFFPNSDQQDSDGNGIGDACELEGDGDGDGVINEEDNCPFTANADQADLDNDGIGDACDEDIDGDGVLNIIDNCPDTANPDQLDENEDGVGDACQTVTGFESELGHINEIKIYPNPASEEVSIQFSLSSSGPVSINLHDISGKKVRELLYEILTDGDYTRSLDIASLNKGIYLVYFELNGNSQTKKLVILH